MIKFHFDSAFVFHSEKIIGHEEGQRGAGVDNDVQEELDMWSAKWDEVRDFVERVDIFRHVSGEQQAHISMNMDFVEFDDGDTIITQGDKGNNFYIIVKGNAIVIENQSSDGIPNELGELDYFGGIALAAFNETHRATVKAQGVLKCITMDKKNFISYVKPVLDILKERSEQYHSFAARCV